MTRFENCRSHTPGEVSFTFSYRFYYLYVLLQTMQVKTILTLCLFAVGSFLFSQNKETIDSLQNVINSNTGHEKMKALESLATIRSNDSLLLAIQLQDQAAILAKELGDQKVYSGLMMNLGIYYYFANQFTESISSLKEALRVYNSIHDTLMAVKVLNNLGVIIQRQGDYEDALKYHQQSLELKKELNDTLGMAKSLNNIGAIFKNIDNLSEALDFTKQALDIYVQIGTTRDLANVYNNLGTIYDELGKTDTALYYLGLSKEFKEDLRDKKGLANTLNNMGMIYSKQGKFNDALETYRESLAIRRSINDSYGIGSSLNNIALLYMDQREYEVAIEYLKNSVEVALAHNLKGLLRRNYLALSQVYDSLRNPNLAFKYYKEFNRIRDDILSEETRTQLANLKIRHETYRLEQENSLLRERDYINQLENEKKQTIIYALLVISLLVIILLIVIYFRFQTKKRANLLLSEKNILVSKQKEELESALEELESTVEEVDKLKEKFRLVADYTYSWEYWVDNQGKFVYNSPSCQRVTGLEPEVFLNDKDRYLNVIHPADREVFRNHLINEGRSSKPGFSEFRIINKEGEIRHIRHICQPVYDNRGNILGRRGTNNDITDQKLAEVELIESEEKYRTLIDKMQDAVFIIQDEKFIFINTAFTRITGYNPADLHEMNFEELVYPEDRNLVVESYYKRQKGQAVPSQYEFRVKKKDGKTIIYVSLSVGIIKYFGKVATLGTLKDISARKVQEEKLQKSETQLRESNATKDRFFSILAHDLKHPFNALLGLSSMLNEDYDELSDKERTTFINNIHESANAAYKLVDNLLQWARTQTGKIVFNPEMLNLGEIVEEVIGLLRPQAAGKEISVATEDVNKQVFTDKHMLLTVLRNLISNAIKFTNSGGKVVINSKEMNNFIEISVSDNGIGISETDIPRLFKLDQHVNTKGTNNESGTGLGLIICKEFIERCGGRIWVDSSPDKGSTFYFSLPHS